MMMHYRIPTDVWSEVALQMLEVGDLVALERASSSRLLPPPLPAGAAFIATRVLDDDEVDWFAARGIPVTLVSEEHVDEPVKGYFMRRYLRNGKLHRDNGLPAFVSEACCRWYRNGKLHRDDDLPAVECYAQNEFRVLVMYYLELGHIIIRGERQWWIDGLPHRTAGRPAIEYKGGGREWFVRGQLHRDGGLPAYDVDGILVWYVDGLLHRENDSPAFVCSDGRCMWYWRGQLHRDHDRPAVESADGGREWWFQGQRHRENDLPAQVYGGYQVWWRNGRRHRDAGRPAIVRASWPKHEWYVDGVYVRWWQRQWWRW